MSASTPHEDCIPPLIIVEGFLGSSGTLIWGRFEHYLNWAYNSGNSCRRRTMFATVGPVSSLHDRACELFYAVTGGTVDYGEEHSRIHQHSRYGRTHSQGLYPQWSRAFPLHFLGHSMGGSTIIKLQTLIKHGHFGPSAHPDMLQSVTSISAPFRGTQVVYTLGERPDAAPFVRPFSCGYFLAKGVHLVSFLSPLLPGLFDLHVESRALTFRDTTFVDFLRQLWRSDWAESRDATPFDVTFESADEREGEGEGLPNPNTFYRSVVAQLTQRASENSSTHSPRSSTLVSPITYFVSQAMGSFDFATLRPVPSFLAGLSRGHVSDVKDVESCIPTDQLGEEYYANDGVVPVFSQWHPLPCSETKCRHDLPSKSTVEPGVWDVCQVDDASHLSIVPFWTGNARQRAFWCDLGDWLHTIDMKTSRHCCCLNQI